MELKQRLLLHFHIAYLKLLNLKFIVKLKIELHSHMNILMKIML